MRRSRMEKAMDLRKAIYSRRAVREFSAEPVDEKTLRQLINAAILARLIRQKAPERLASVV